MSVVTKRGDDGGTDLLFGRRVAKSDPRVDAIGTIDELNALLGVARATGLGGDGEAAIDGLQGKLVGLMGELAVHPDDASRYAESDFPAIKAEDVEELEGMAAAIEAEGISFDGWARPGAKGNLAGARLDVARAVCRRAERRVLSLGGEVSNPQIALFLNRCSDLLWLMARRTEQD